MEIEFNTGRIPQTESSQPVAKRVATPATTPSVSFSASDSLKSQLNAISTIRPELVAKAKALVADPTYPPDYVLKRIAVLLALNAKDNSNNPSGQSS